MRCRSDISPQKGQLPRVALKDDTSPKADIFENRWFSLLHIRA